MTITLIPFNEVRLSPEPNYLVKGLIPRIGTSLVWGPPKSGKTFWLFDLAYHVAGNRTYRGRKVRGGPVVYCCFEGIEGYGARIAAIRQNAPRDGLVTPLYLVPARLDLAADYPGLIEAVQSGLPNGQQPAAIILDTLNRSLAGSESSDADMGAYIRAADALKDRFSCAVIVVHHSGHEAGRPRGHSSLTAAIDAQLSVKRDRRNQVIVEVEWMRDGPEGDRVISRLEPVEVGTNSESDTITSCIVVPVEAATNDPAQGELSDRERLALDALATCTGPDGLVRRPTWLRAMQSNGAIAADHGNPRTAQSRIVERLESIGRIVVQDRCVRLVS